MGIGRSQDEWEANYLRSQQRERRHAVTGLPEIFHQCELAVRIGPDQSAVHLDVLGRGRQILVGQRCIGLSQVHLCRHRTGRLVVRCQRTADQVNLIHQAARIPMGLAGLIPRRPIALTDQMPAVGHRGSEVETDQLIAEVRVPQRAAGKIHAIAVDQASGFREAAGVFLLRGRQREVHRTAVGQLQRTRTLRQRDPVTRDGLQFPQHHTGAVDTGKAPFLVRQPVHVGIGILDLQDRRQQKLDRASGQFRRQFDDSGYLQLMSTRLDANIELVAGFVFGIRRPRHQKQQQNRTPGATEISQALMQRIHCFARAN